MLYKVAKQLDLTKQILKQFDQLTFEPSLDVLLRPIKPGSIILLCYNGVIQPALFAGQTVIQLKTGGVTGGLIVPICLIYADKKWSDLRYVAGQIIAVPQEDLGKFDEEECHMLTELEIDYHKKFIN